MSAISIKQRATRLGMGAIRKAHAWYKLPRHRAAMRQYRAITFEPGDIAIDCGANVGNITSELVARGASVYAFEPNPVPFRLLSERTRDNDKVVCLQQAVSDHNGQTRLYLHRKHVDGSMAHAQGSSLVAEKHNLSKDHSVDVDVIDLAEFIQELPRRVRLLKIDVEGLEALLVNHLIDTGAIRRIDHVFCETHEYKVPGLAQQCRELRRRLAAEGLDHVNLDWH